MNICFVINICKDIHFAEKLLDKLLSIYSMANIIILLDGIENNDFINKFKRYKNKLQIIVGDRLRNKDIGKWVLRWITQSLMYSKAEIFVKIDPDTEINNKLSFIPSADYFGCTYSPKGFKSWYLQDGCYGFKRNTLEKMAKSGVLNDFDFCNDKSLASETMINKYEEFMVSEALLLDKICKKLRFSFYEHPEIFACSALPRKTRKNSYPIVHISAKTLIAEERRVFGIGLHKTGNHSLLKALKLLGYDAMIFPQNIRTVINDKEAIVDVAAYFYWLMNEYPNSKYILTVRNLESWHKSCETHFNHRFAVDKLKFHRTAMRFVRLQLYGRLDYNREAFQEKYDQYLRHVTEFFKNKDNLLILDICGGEGWEKLCPFLGYEIRTDSFPHEFKTPSRMK